MKKEKFAALVHKEDMELYGKKTFSNEGLFLLWDTFKDIRAIKEEEISEVGLYWSEFYVNKCPYNLEDFEEGLSALYFKDTLGHQKVLCFS